MNLRGFRRLASCLIKFNEWILMNVRGLCTYVCVCVWLSVSVCVWLEGKEGSKDRTMLLLLWLAGCTMQMISPFRPQDEARFSRCGDYRLEMGIRVRHRNRKLNLTEKKSYVIDLRTNGVKEGLLYRFNLI